MVRNLAVIALFAAAVFAGRHAAAGETVRLATHEWPPYQMTVNGQIDGIAARVLNCALDRIGFAADITMHSWSQAQQLVKDGDADGFFPAAQNAQRDAFAIRSMAIAPQAWRWYWRRDRQVAVEDRELAVGVQYGTATEQWLIDNGYTHIHAAATVQEVIKQLESDHVEATQANQLVFDWGMMLAGAKETSLTSQLVRAGSLGVYYGKGFLERHPGFLIRFNAEIPDCRVKAQLPAQEGAVD